jgi:biotin-(acetyl-CoA carboxylase) ligase
MRRGVIAAIRHVDTVTSTMDVAKEMITAAAAATSGGGRAPAPDNPSQDDNGAVIRVGEPFGVLAKVQTHGRGTAGREWVSPSGNLFLTLAVPTDRIATEVIPVLPLVVGIAVREAIQKCSALATAASSVSQKPTALEGGVPGAPAPPTLLTKWPNDTVWEGRKVSGALIESAEGFLLIGVGVNLVTAPTVADGGRPTVCLCEIMQACRSPRLFGPTPSEVAEHIWTELFTLLERAEVGGKEVTRGYIVDRFSSLMDWSLTLRKRNAERTAVRAVRMNAWGHLVVKPIDGGDEEVLVSEYLY